MRSRKKVYMMTVFRALLRPIQRASKFGVLKDMLWGPASPYKTQTQTSLLNVGSAGVMWSLGKCAINAHAAMITMWFVSLAFARCDSLAGQVLRFIIDVGFDASKDMLWGPASPYRSKTRTSLLNVGSTDEAHDLFKRTFSRNTDEARDLFTRTFNPASKACNGVVLTSRIQMCVLLVIQAFLSVCICSYSLVAMLYILCMCYCDGTEAMNVVDQNWKCVVDMCGGHYCRF